MPVPGNGIKYCWKGGNNYYHPKCSSIAAVFVTGAIGRLLSFDNAQGDVPVQTDWNYKCSGNSNINKTVLVKGNSAGKTHKPSEGGKKADRPGIYCMSGNVWEFTEDQHLAEILLANAALHGGSWYNSNAHAVIENRILIYNITHKYASYGFCVVYSL